MPDGKVFVTGASGLLGRAIVKKLASHNLTVMAHYFRNKPDDIPGCKWLYADFSDLAAIRSFLKSHQHLFSNCQYLVNNYGPIIHKNISQLTSEDISADIHNNLISAWEITNFFIRFAELKSTVFIGFGGIGSPRAYKKILSYAVSKNALALIHHSLSQEYKAIRFNMVSPNSLTGASIKSPSGEEVSSDMVAGEIYSLLVDDRRDENVLL